MARGPSTFKESDATRLVPAVRKAGCKVFAVSADVRGKIIVMTDSPIGENNKTDGNAWDEVLPDAAHEKRTS
jgi:hypothetical protein